MPLPLLRGLKIFSAVVLEPAGLLLCSGQQNVPEGGSRAQGVRIVATGRCGKNGTFRRLLLACRERHHVEGGVVRSMLIIRGRGSCVDTAATDGCRTLSLDEEPTIPDWIGAVLECFRRGLGGPARIGGVEETGCRSRRSARWWTQVRWSGTPASMRWHVGSSWLRGR
jgi:hypothetical protein